MPPGVELEKAKRGGEAIRSVRPAGARWIAVKGRAAIGRVLGHRSQAEVDDDELPVCDEQVVGLEILVRDRLLLEIVEARDEVFGETSLRRGLGRGVLGEPLPQVNAAHSLHDKRKAPLDHLGQVDDPDDVLMIEPRR